MCNKNDSDTTEQNCKEQQEWGPKRTVLSESFLAENPAREHHCDANFLKLKTRAVMAILAAFAEQEQRLARTRDSNSTEE